MTTSGDTLTRDLVQLRSRRGLRAVGTGAKVGPALQAICHIDASDTAGEKQRKISEWIQALMPQLPEDHRWALSVALGISADADHDTYQARAQWAADQEGYSLRTFDRRVNRVFLELAALSGAPTPDAAPEPEESTPQWKTEELRLFLSLECEVPEAIEIRRITAQIEGLNEIDLAVSVPPQGETRRTADELDLVIFSGGTITDHRMVTSDRHGVFVQLPRPLAKGEPHEIVLRYRARTRLPYFVCVARYPCDLFDLRVRFGLQQPASIHRLDGVLQGDARDSEQRGPRIELNASSETRVVFEHLKPGFAYGLKWVEGATVV